MDFLIFTISISFLIYGSNLVVNESERISLHFNISPFIIGVSLVAFGTSLPEMVAGVIASYKNESELVVSNVIGSTIFNISLILGLVFLLSKKMKPKRDIFAKDSAWGLFPILIFIITSLDGKIDAIEGVLFLFVMVAYLLFIKSDLKENSQEKPTDKENFKWVKSSLALFLGFVFVVGGANFTIDSAVSIAYTFGVKEWIVGIFLIAVGTSLPELAVSIRATMKNQLDMAIGAIIGSNVSNFTIVLGISSFINPLTVSLKENMFDVVVAFIVSLMLVFITANRLYNKSAGIVLLVTLGLVINNAIKTL
jgi:cation:H+ antiporter